MYINFSFIFYIRTILVKNIGALDTDCAKFDSHINNKHSNPPLPFPRSMLCVVCYTSKVLHNIDKGDRVCLAGPLLRICNWVGHLSQGTKNNVKRGPEKNRNFEKSKNRKIEKIEKSKNRNFADRNFLFDYFSIFHCPEREGKGIAEILRKEYWNKD